LSITGRAPKSALGIVRCRKRDKPDPKPHAAWHLDEVYLKVDGRMVYLWRAADAEGKVLVCSPIQAQQARRVETDAQAFKEIRRRS
jgi:transposase-like protein